MNELIESPDGLNLWYISGGRWFRVHRIDKYRDGVEIPDIEGMGTYCIDVIGSDFTNRYLDPEKESFNARITFGNDEKLRCREGCDAVNKDHFQKALIHFIGSHIEKLQHQIEMSGILLQKLKKLENG